MAKTDLIEVQGKIEEALANAQFKVKLDNGHSILCHVSGRMRKNFIRVIPGDKVEIEISPYDLTKGRISRRVK